MPPINLPSPHITKGNSSYNKYTPLSNALRTKKHFMQNRRGKSKRFEKWRFMWNDEEWWWWWWWDGESEIGREMGGRRERRNHGGRRQRDKYKWASCACMRGQWKFASEERVAETEPDGEGWCKEKGEGRKKKRWRVYCVGEGGGGGGRRGNGKRARDAKQNPKSQKQILTENKSRSCYSWFHTKDCYCQTNSYHLTRRRGT